MRVEEYQNRLEGQEDLLRVITELHGWLDPEAIEDWLYGINSHLGGRMPMMVIARGRTEEVLDAIRAEKSGAHT